MLSTRKLIQQSLRTVIKRFSTGSLSRLRVTQNGDDKPVINVPIKTFFYPDRAGGLPLNMIPELTELASFQSRGDDIIGEMLVSLEKGGLLSIAKTQEIQIFPDFYKYWKPNRKLQINYLLHDIGTKSFNVQFDVCDETNTIVLCRNYRSIVVCDVKLKPAPIPEEAMKIMSPAAFQKERYFIPQPYSAKSGDTYEASTIVRPSDLDMYYHLNQANYMTFMLDTAVSAARNGAYKSLKQDISFSSVNHIVLDYGRELCLDDNVKIETWEDDEHPMKLCFEMSTAGKLAFRGSILLREPLLKFSDEMKKKFPRAEEF